MPKLKTNRGAAKRFRATASGFKCRRSFRNHILTKKSNKHKRSLCATGRVDDSDVHSVSRMLPYAAKKIGRRRRLFNSEASIEVSICAGNEGK
ncbi:MAG: ribosomal protein [Gammaproteobacteria bacterium]|jgi:large subunit ribosomal protein L35|nr:ribosomal protein [Gammaproteobacteria bacterium]